MSYTSPLKITIEQDGFKSEWYPINEVTEHLRKKGMVLLLFNHPSLATTTAVFNVHIDKGEINYEELNNIITRLARD